jgi:hypothetical protein
VSRSLSLALKSSEAELVEEAEVIVNEMGARGMLEFRDLLESRTSGATKAPHRVSSRVNRDRSCASPRDASL